MLKAYRFFTELLSPLVVLWLHIRKWRGKEDAKRLRERFGFASKPRPSGTLLWLHAASVGEANSVLLLINKLRERYPHIQLLLTTGTVTSAQLMGIRLPEGVIHQYAPVDTPEATWKFMRHWKPDFAFWVESELWPNLIYSADIWQCFIGLLNGRMSQRSFARWQQFPSLIHNLLSRFNVILAQSDADARRLQALGAKDVEATGNLKYDAAALPCDEGELLELKNTIGRRPMWLAASTHPGEEASIAEVHRLLSTKMPNLLTILVPRHPRRGGEIAQMLRKHGRLTQRSRQEPITAQTSFYLADTLGELGLFYRLSGTAFMGGSLVKHGGQNPLEPSRLSCAIVTGPHTHNFADIYAEMERTRAVWRVKDTAELAAQIGELLGNASTLQDAQNAARSWVEAQGGAIERTLEALAPALDVRRY